MVGKLRAKLKLRIKIFRVKKRKMEEVNVEEEESNNLWDCLHDDVVAKILSFVPLKPRTRFKCVSKSWCTIVNNLTSSENISSSLVLSSRRSVTTLLFREKDVVTEQVFDIPRCFSVSPLIDSRNGWLLFANHVCYLDFNDNYDDKDRYFKIPVMKFCSLSRLFDCWRHGFKMMRLKRLPNRKRDRKIIPYYVFSSDTWEWTQHEARVLKPSDLAFGTNSSRKLYWLSLAFVLVYDLDDNFFSIINLPEKLLSHKYYTQWYHHVWESEGCLVYFKPTVGKLSMWIYDHRLNKWLNRGICYEEIEGGENLKHHWFYVQALAFIEELQILYLYLVGIIYRYSFVTRRLSAAWSWTPSETRRLSADGLNDAQIDDLLAGNVLQPLSCLRFRDQCN